MKKTTMLLASTAYLCLANSPAAFYFQCAVLDRIAAVARTASPMRYAALQALESVAGGRAADASLEPQLGLKPGQLREPEFRESIVRAHAFRKLGSVGLPEALEYLQNLKREDIGPDVSGSIWPAARIALHEAELERIANPASKIEFLEGTITEPHDAFSGSAVTSWAIQQLCDRGALSALPTIERSIRSLYHGQPGDDEIQFCQSRMQVISRDPDRVVALGSILRVESGVPDLRLAGWAISELGSMRSAAADAELERFANEISKLPEGSPARQRLSPLKENIRQARYAAAGMGPAPLEPPK